MPEDQKYTNGYISSEGENWGSATGEGVSLDKFRKSCWDDSDIYLQHNFMFEYGPII